MSATLGSLALAASMQATGVAAAETAGNVIFVDFCSGTIIPAYAAATGTTTAAVETAIASGVTIGTGGVIVIGAVAFAVIAAIILWWISQHPELEEKGTEATIYNQKNVTVPRSDGGEFTIYSAEEWGYSSSNPFYWAPMTYGVSISNRIDVTFANGARLVKNDDSTSYYSPNGDIRISRGRSTTGYGAVILHPTNPNYCTITPCRVTSGNFFSYVPQIPRDPDAGLTWEQRKELGIDVSNPTGWKDGWFNIHQLFISPDGYNGGEPENTGSPANLPGRVTQIQKETSNLPSLDDGQEITINTGASTLEIPNPNLDEITNYVNEQITNPDKNPQKGLNYQPSFTIEEKLNPNPKPTPIPITPPVPAPEIPTEPVTPPTLPVLGSTSSGMVRLWNPTAEEMGEISKFMLSGDFIDQVVKLFADPADYLLSLSLQPVVPSVSNKESIYIGSLPVPNITVSPVNSQYATVDFGSIEIPAVYNSFVDYDTQFSIFLPFIGEQPLNTQDMIGSTIHLQYNVDVLTGTFAALLRVTRSTNGIDLDAVLYQWQGNLAAQIPIRASSWNVGITDIAAGALAGAAGGPYGALAGAGVALGKGLLKPRISGSGSLSGNAGLLGIQYPYLIINRPRTATPSNYKGYSGVSTSEVSRLGDLTGYTMVQDTHLQGIPATSDELDEILSLLKGGVIL